MEIFQAFQDRVPVTTLQYYWFSTLPDQISALPPPHLSEGCFSPALLCLCFPQEHQSSLEAQFPHTSRTIWMTSLRSAYWIKLTGPTRRVKGTGLPPTKWHWATEQAGSCVLHHADVKVSVWQERGWMGFVGLIVYLTACKVSCCSGFVFPFQFPNWGSLFSFWFEFACGSGRRFSWLHLLCTLLPFLLWFCFGLHDLLSLQQSSKLSLTDILAFSAPFLLAHPERWEGGKKTSSVVTGLLKFSFQLS